MDWMDEGEWRTRSELGNEQQRMSLQPLAIRILRAGHSMGIPSTDRLGMGLPSAPADLKAATSLFFGMRKVGTCLLVGKGEGRLLPSRSEPRP